MLCICEARCAVEQTANNKPRTVRFIASRPLRRIEFLTNESAQRSYQESPLILTHWESTEFPWRPANVLSKQAQAVAVRDSLLIETVSERRKPERILGILPINGLVGRTNDAPKFIEN
jgi:hypothetical protein